MMVCRLGNGSTNCAMALPGNGACSPGSSAIARLALNCHGKSNPAPVTALSFKNCLLLSMAPSK
jgi:hypothetical protein